MQNSIPQSDGKIGVVTVTHNSNVFLPEFFDSLSCQTYRNFIVYAVDSASTDETVETLRRKEAGSFKVLVNDTNVGIATGNNQGIHAAIEDGCEYVMLLNNDVVFGPDLFAQLVTGLNENGGDMAVPLIYFHKPATKIWAAGGEFQHWLGYRIHHRGEGEEDIGRYDKITKVEFAPGCCVLIRRGVFQRIGLMDERYFVYSEDVDFMYRALRVGISTFVVPQAKLWHKVHGLTGGSLSDFTLYYGARGRALFLYKHFDRSLAFFWSWSYTMFCWLRPFFLRDTWHRSGIRRKGIRDGRATGRTQDVQNQVVWPYRDSVDRASRPGRGI